jgi:hypothetical protein
MGRSVYNTVARASTVATASIETGVAEANGVAHLVLEHPVGHLVVDHGVVLSRFYVGPRNLRVSAAAPTDGRFAKPSYVHIDHAVGR